MAHGTWDDRSWDVLSARLIELARDAGALTVLPIGLSLRFALELFAGEFATAESLAEEAEALSEVTRRDFAPLHALLLAAWRGRQEETARLIEVFTKPVVAWGEGQWLTATHYSTAVLYNGLGRFDEALVAAEQAREYPYELGHANFAMGELVEAAARSGKPARAAETVECLGEMACATATDWALGSEACARALVSDGETAEALYREAIERLGRTRIRVQLARAHLLYGEWLRREHRRQDAREQLRTAHQMFGRIGMEAFAKRAGRELSATGEHARKRVAETLDDLTPQEHQVARMARDGTHQRDRRTAVHQPPHRQVPPAEGLRQARHQLARPARPSSRASTKRRADRLTTERRPRCRAHRVRRPRVRVRRPTTGHDCPRGLSTCRMRVQPVDGHWEARPSRRRTSQTTSLRL